MPGSTKGCPVRTRWKARAPRVPPTPADRKRSRRGPGKPFLHPSRPSSHHAAGYGGNPPARREPRAAHRFPGSHGPRSRYPDEVTRTLTGHARVEPGHDRKPHEPERHDFMCLVLSWIYFEIGRVRQRKTRSGARGAAAHGIPCRAIRLVGDGPALTDCAGPRSRRARSPGTPQGLRSDRTAHRGSDGAPPAKPRDRPCGRSGSCRRR
jgi:hypothetical protein